jgi:hypothetical protein
LHITTGSRRTKKGLVQPEKPSPARKRRQLSTAITTSLVNDQKVLHPFSGTKLPRQPAGLFASPTPFFRGLVWVTVFRENFRIWSTAGLFLRPHCLKSLSELPQALFKDALFISNPRRERFCDLVFQHPQLIS